MKNIHRIEHWNSYLKKTKNLRFAVAFVVANVISVQPAHGQESDIQQEEVTNLTGCVQIDDLTQGNILVCDSPLFTKYHGILSEGGMDVVNADAFWDFLESYGPILEFLDGRVGVTAGDIISAINLFDAEINKQSNYIEFTLRFIDFTSGFPNPDIGLEDFLKQRGIFLND